jgi:hypothetical protein
MKPLKYTLPFFMILFLWTGCSLKKQPPKEITQTQGYATLTPSTDFEHYDSSLGGSTIFIKHINGKRLNKFAQQQNHELISKVGHLRIYVEENNTSDYIFGATLHFKAKLEEQYLISSTHIIENNKIVDVEFYVLNRGKIVTKASGKRIRRATAVPLSIPSSI